MAKCLAGALGFEPRNGGTENCFTTSSHDLQTGARKVYPVPKQPKSASPRELKRANSAAEIRGASRWPYDFNVGGPDFPRPHPFQELGDAVDLIIVAAEGKLHEFIA
jgi:hypothetical protein